MTNLKNPTNFYPGIDDSVVCNITLLADSLLIVVRR